MLKASWPDRGAGGRASISPAVRRSVDRAMRMSVSRALPIGAVLIAAGVSADVLHLLLRFGEAAFAPVLLEIAVIAAIVVLALSGARAGRRPEPAALAMVLLLSGVTLVNIELMPGASASGAAYLAIILVGSALFLPWSPRWHAGLLLGVVVLTTLLLGATWVAGRLPAAGVTLIMSTSLAALASAVGQPIAYRRLRSMVEQHLELRRLSRLAARQDHEVGRLNEELVRTSRLDALTGIANRRALDEALIELSGRRLAALLLDLDHFKLFNDRNGHLAGDAALARVGQILRANVRGPDLAFRYGGEEFLVLLPDGDSDGAAALAERLRAAIKDQTADTLGLTISIGVAVADRFRSDDPVWLLKRADAALYQAKRAGRNRVAVDGMRSASLATAHA